MKLGVVGLPNVGKSTLFNAITNAGAMSANYPFCTIEPNVGVVAVPDERLEKLAALSFYDAPHHNPEPANLNPKPFLYQNRPPEQCPSGRFPHN